VIRLIIRKEEIFFFEKRKGRNMPKRQGQESQNQRRGGDLDGKRSRPARRRKHLYLILDDWEKGFSVHKIDDDPDAGAAVAGHLPDPPAAAAGVTRGL